METQNLIDFAKMEHERLVTHFKVKGDPKTRYTMLAKLMEEVGELSEAILKTDALQRGEKLREPPDLAGEFADVILSTMVLSQELKIDMQAALQTKIAKIRARKY